MRVVQKVFALARPDVVWQILAELEHWSDWTPTMTEIKPLTNSGLTVGARYRVVQPKLRPAIYEVTECVPNQTLTWIQKFPGGVMIADHRLSPHHGGTEIELSFSSEGLLATIIGKMFSKTISDYVASETESLKNRSERLAMGENGVLPNAIENSKRS